VKGFSLLGVDQVIDLPVADAVDFFTQRVSDLILKKCANPVGDFHRFPVLLEVSKVFPAYKAAHCENGSRERAAGFTPSGHPPGESAACFENLLASHIQLFLQSCKNGLGSAAVGPVVVKGQLEHFLQ
jgi:hypothetical protein